MASHATVADLLSRYDVRRVGDLVKDDDTRATSQDLLGSTSANAVVTTALADATGTINSAILAGKRYLLEDLLGMSSESKSLLARLCCDLAYALLLGRRGYGSTDLDAMAARASASEDLLEKLRSGERVFETDKHTNAGLPNQAVVSSSTALFSREMDRYFGIRSNTLHERTWP